ncbi:RNA pseudouridine synthase [Ramlibacter pallidus]|uniref:Dual-specificity RNA pseudouridine synthase RluF n=1 Tax=Ramlibacter pallidus TaxID=2780087 RepID=A0ABR9S749_9BURK|nr:RNA pseudouridine synthase [Ramlibacter pallidus]MBE7369351.1 RNA-binding protein [Ramlibacter pallidus]
MADEPTRLSKVVAALVPCSRREAEQYIAEGWVRVDGQVVEEPQFRVSGQRVEVDPRARLQPVQPATFLVHKPATFRSPQAQDLPAEARWAGDDSGIRRVKSHAAALVALLPLPVPASGLAVLSQDGRIVRKLTEEARTIEQELLADVTGTLAPGGLERLCRGGLVLEGRVLPPARVSWQSEARLRFAVKGIPPEALPWMCAQVGLQLTALKRLRIGRVPLAGLPPGQWRYLRPDERF